MYVSGWLRIIVCLPWSTCVSAESVGVFTSVLGHLHMIAEVMRKVQRSHQGQWEEQEVTEVRSQGTESLKVLQKKEASPVGEGKEVERAGKEEPTAPRRNQRQGGRGPRCPAEAGRAVPVGVEPQRELEGLEGAPRRPTGVWITLRGRREETEKSPAGQEFFTQQRKCKSRGCDPQGAVLGPTRGPRRPPVGAGLLVPETQVSPAPQVGTGLQLHRGPQKFGKPPRLFSPKKKERILSFATPWVAFEGIRLNKVSQTEKQKRTV